MHVHWPNMHASLAKHTYEVFNLHHVLTLATVVTAKLLTKRTLMSTKNMFASELICESPSKGYCTVMTFSHVMCTKWQHFPLVCSPGGHCWLVLWYCTKMVLSAAMWRHSPAYLLLINSILAPDVHYSWEMHCPLLRGKRPMGWFGVGLWQIPQAHWICGVKFAHGAEWLDKLTRVTSTCVCLAPVYIG